MHPQISRPPLPPCYCVPVTRQQQDPHKNFIWQSAINGTRSGIIVGIITTALSLLTKKKDYKKGYMQEVQKAKQWYQEDLKQLKKDRKILKTPYSKTLKSKAILKEELKNRLTESKRFLQEMSKMNFKKNTLIGLGACILAGGIAGFIGAKAKLKASAQNNSYTTPQEENKTFRKTTYKNAFFLGTLYTLGLWGKELGKLYTKIHAHGFDKVLKSSWDRVTLISTPFNILLATLIWGATATHAANKAEKQLS